MAPALPLIGCRGESGRVSRAERADEGSAAVPDAITRPVLVPWGHDAVRMSAPTSELPVAYVSMGHRELYVDHDFRDRVYWDLRAHISVSTGVWRIPLVGDPPKEPVTPGDLLREFEELSIRDWDPTEEPVEGDIRILRGRATSKHVDLACASVAGGRAWLRAGPWDILQCGEPNEALCREDFMSVGIGTLYADRDCTRPEGPVRLITWACLEEFIPSVD